MSGKIFSLTYIKFLNLKFNYSIRYFPVVGETQDLLSENEKITRTTTKIVILIEIY